MARKASVILTPAEKSAAIAVSKESIKTAKQALNGAESARSALEKEHTKKVKELDKARKDLDKLYESNVKASDRLLLKLRKDLTAQQLNHQALAPPKITQQAETAEPSPTS